MKMIGHMAARATGPGGRDCYCCGDARGAPRKKAKRTVKRRERQQWKREVAA